MLAVEKEMSIPLRLSDLNFYLSPRTSEIQFEILLKLIFLIMIFVL